MKNTVAYKIYDTLRNNGADLPSYDAYFNGDDIYYEILPRPIYYIMEQDEKYHQLLEDIQNCEILQLTPTQKKEIIADFLHLDVNDIYSISRDEDNNIRLYLNNKQKLFPRIAYETGGAMRYIFRVTDDDNEKFEIIIRGWNS